MRISRDLQNRVLHMLGDAYPGAISDIRTSLGYARTGEDIERLLANLMYLEEHGLISSGYKLHRSLDGEGHWSHNGNTRITATGLDFIAADGGLSAILKTVTVRLDAGQFSELLASKVENLPGVAPEERSELAKAIRKLPATAVEKIAEKMLDWSVDHAGDVLPLLRTLVGMAA